MTVAVTIVTVDCGQYYSELGVTVVDCIANIWEQDVHQVNNYKHKHGQNPGSFLVWFGHEVHSWARATSSVELLVRRYLALE